MILAHFRNRWLEYAHLDQQRLARAFSAMFPLWFRDWAVLVHEPPSDASASAFSQDASHLRLIPGSRGLAFFRSRDRGLPGWKPPPQFPHPLSNCEPHQARTSTPVNLYSEAPYLRHPCGQTYPCGRRGDRRSLNH